MNEKLLEKYYNEKIYKVGKPKWEKLDSEQRELLSISFGFSNYRLAQSWKEFKRKFLPFK